MSATRSSERLPEMAMNVPVQSLLMPVVINAFVAAATFLAFRVVSPRIPWLYCPRSIRANARDTREPPPDISRSTTLEWIRAMYALSERDLVRVIGLDAVVFLRFQRMGMYFFGPLAVVGLVVILPVNAIAPSGAALHATTFRDLSMSHLPEKSPLFWVHLVCAYLFTGYLFYLLRREALAYHDLRHRCHLSCGGEQEGDGAPRPDQLSVALRRIPSHLQNEANLHNYLARLFPDAFASAVVVRDRSVLIRLCKELTGARRHLERACAQFARTGRRVRPTLRTGWFLSSRVDAIDLWTQRIEDLGDQIDVWRKSHGRATAAGFATFTTFAAVALLTHAPVMKEAHVLTCTQAVEPRDVYWPNVHWTDHERQFRWVCVHAVLYILIAFWTIPVSFVSALASLDVLERYIPFLGSLLNVSPLLSDFLQAFLPSVGLLLFQLVLPPILLFLSQQQGCTSRSSLRSSVFTKFFLFQFINFFLVSMISGSLIDTLSAIAEHPTRTPILLSSALSSQAATFVAYVLLQALSRVPLQLLRLGALIQSGFSVTFLVSTPEQLFKAVAPGAFAFAQEWPMHLFIFFLGLTYAEITPLILPCVALFFVVSQFVYRYLLIFVHEPKYETGGRLFRLAFSRLFIGIAVGLMTLMGMLALKQASAQFGLLVLLLIATYRFYVHCSGIIASAESLSCEEALDMDRSPRFDASAFAAASASFYRQPCELVPIVDPGEVQEFILSTSGTVLRVPKTSAVSELVELESRRIVARSTPGTPARPFRRPSGTTAGAPGADALV